MPAKAERKIRSALPHNKEVFLMNPATILVGLLVLAIFVAIIARGIYNRRHHKGSCSCGGSCGSCPSSGLCHPKES